MGGGGEGRGGGSAGQCEYLEKERGEEDTRLPKLANNNNNNDNTGWPNKLNFQITNISNINMSMKYLGHTCNEKLIC